MSARQGTGPWCNCGAFELFANVARILIDAFWFSAVRCCCPRERPFTPDSTGEPHASEWISKAIGEIEIAGEHFSEGQLLVFRPGDAITVRAITSARLLLLGGEPLDGPRHIWWNFVSSRKERIEQAKEDWKQGRIILPPNDNKEFIPLPEDKSRPAGSPPRPEPLS